MSVYVIEQQIAFDTDVLTIARLDAPEVKIIISAAAARCMVALTEAGGETVTRDQLMHVGWGASGQVVTENSLNQAITQLRKAFKEAQLPGDFILTLPRAGYKISRLFSVELMPREALVREEQAAAPAPPPLENTAPQRSRLRIKLSSWMVMLCVIIASALLFMTVHRTVIQQWSIKYHQVNYIPVNTPFKQLNVFTNDAISQHGDYIEKAINQLESDRWLSTLVRERGPYVYINGSYNRDVFSYFLCQQDIQHYAESCEAYTSIREGKEHAQK